MRIRSKSESGLAHVVLLILIMVVIAAIIFVGLRVVSNQNTGETTGSVPAPVASSNTTVPGTIKNNADLSAAQASLNQTNIDGDLNPDSLNADLNSVL
jgi:flagellar basal body-associated protein FliL